MWCCCCLGLVPHQKPHNPSVFLAKHQDYEYTHLSRSSPPGRGMLALSQSPHTPYQYSCAGRIAEAFGLFDTGYLYARPWLRFHAVFWPEDFRIRTGQRLCPSINQVLISNYRYDIPFVDCSDCLLGMRDVS